MNERVYLAIDLKSFFASVECVERGLDPLKTHLVVADASRTEKTICLAVSPSMKAYGIPGRPRLFEVVQKVREINLQRGAPRSPSNPQRGFFSGGGIGKIAGIENGLHHRPAPDGPLYGGQYPGLSIFP